MSISADGIHLVANVTPERGGPTSLTKASGTRTIGALLTQHYYQSISPARTPQPVLFNCENRIVAIFRLYLLVRQLLHF
jgi:hypothetical protein